MLDLNDIYVSSGSACNSNSVEPSAVLRAINVPNEYIRSAIRITLANDITFDELDYVYETFLKCIERLNNLI